MEKKRKKITAICSKLMYTIHVEKVDSWILTGPHGLSGEAETSTKLQQRWAKGATQSVATGVTEAVLPSREPLLHVVVRSVFLWRHGQ